MEWIKKFPFENILLDAALLVVAFALPSTNLLLSENLTAAFWLAAPFQVLALFCAFYGRDSYSPGRNLPEWLSLAYILNTILAVGSFIWLYLVAFAVEKQTGGFPYWGFRFAFFVALFGGILVFGFSLGRSDGDELSLKTRYLLVLIVFLFLSFTESLLEVSLGISNVGAIVLVVVTLISYLPVRLALAFQPPFSYWDLASAIVCFVVYLYSIL
jgi:hypothetical protein